MNFQFGTAILILATGCSDSAQLLQLQQEIESLRAENQELRVGQEAIKTSLEAVGQLKGLTTDFESLRKDWGSFEKGFEASLREELQKNIESAAAALQSIRTSNESSGAIVKEIEGLAIAAAELKALCAQHESEARKLNSVGDLQKAVADFDAQLKSFNLKLTTIQNDVRRTQMTADDAKRNADDAKRKADDAKRKADRAILR